MLAKNARIWKIPNECVIGHTYLVVPPIEGYQIGVHNSCSCNELISLTNRHLVDRTLPGYDKTYMKDSFNSVSKTWKFELERMAMLAVVNSYRGGKRRLYNRAMHEVKNFGLGKTDHHVRMFVKPDKISMSEINTKAPRAIQYRNPRYNLVLATYLKPYEHAFYELVGSDGLRVVTKGLNNVEIAKLMLDKAALYENPVYINCDHSKFDSTINVDHLKFEHMIYNRTFPSLKNLLRKQLKNRGYTRSGIHYKVVGTRMSGDYNTSLGNSLLNRAVLESWLKNIKHSLILDGDDSVIIVEAKDVHKLDLSHFEKCGFTTTTDLCYDITEVEYCKKRLVMSDPPILMRSPLRVLSNMAICTRNYGGEGFKRWAYGVMECERLMHPGVPILSKFPEGKVIKDDDYYRKLVGSKTDVVQCTLKHISDTWKISEHVLQVLDENAPNYFGYNHSDIIGNIKSLSCLEGDKLRHLLEYVSNTHAKHTEAISQRFHTLHSGYNECWIAVGTPIMGYESYAKCFTVRPTPKFPNAEEKGEEKVP